MFFATEERGSPSVGGARSDLLPESLIGTRLCRAEPFFVEQGKR